MTTIQAIQIHLHLVVVLGPTADIILATAFQATIFIVAHPHMIGRIPFRRAHPLRLHLLSQSPLVASGTTHNQLGMDGNKTVRMDIVFSGRIIHDSDLQKYFTIRNFTKNVFNFCGQSIYTGNKFIRVINLHDGSHRNPHRSRNVGPNQIPDPGVDDGFRAIAAHVVPAHG